MSERAKNMLAFTIAGLVMLIVASAVMAVMWHLEPSAVVVRQSSCQVT